ncbi:MAG: hypothetical protein Q9208_008736 [Pyrenodesmia sp. 3 TL-2023]
MKMFHRFRRKKTAPLVIPTITETLPQSPHQQQTENFPNALAVHRNGTTISNLSSYDIDTRQTRSTSAEARRRERSDERRADPLGLNVIYAPNEGIPTVDIILVHGLGGTSQKTWCRNRDAEYFWPEKWLPSEPGFQQARILSFGYNAHFASSGRENILNIADFAKDLLFGMKYSLDHKSQELGIGRAPIIFVAHSMGGLVVKKAFILGQSDNQYRHIMTSTSAILFLSTPHRGTNLAELLNRILAVSVFNHSAKHYIAELKQNSPALQDINEQFRNIAPQMQIFSFFETHQTAVGPKKMMVLEKDSSILGYPNEVSKPLDADHHNVCKYSSQEDPNYVSVRNALRSVLGRVSKLETVPHASVANEMDMSKVEALLAIQSSPEEDYEYFQSRWMAGSCEWILLRSEFQSWLVGDHGVSRILWLHGVPGCGKSVLSAFLVRRLEDMGHSCQYFFFRFGDKTKRSVNLLLRSLAYQVAVQFPELRLQLEKLADDAVRLEKAESRIIWQKRLEPSVRIDRLAADQSTNDLELYVAQEVQYMRGDRLLKTRVIQRVCGLAKGNFLWVHLVLKEILQCHTEAAIDQALEEIPSELEPLYHRMEATLSRTSKAADRGLAKTILTWVICSQRALKLDELSEALKPEFSHVLDLQVTISQVCGDFIVVDARSRVDIVHQTAREYLVKTPGLDHGITLGLGHQVLFMKCLSVLSRPIRRTRNDRVDPPTFLHYAATSWPFHLSQSAASLDHSMLLALNQFFQGSHVFAWISLLAAMNHLKTLAYASQGLISYLGRKARVDAESSPLTHKLHEKEVLERWAVDLVKIIGKFGAQLVKHPNSIYTLVPSFCPTTTMISQHYRRNRATECIAVTGFSQQQWDDCLSKFSVGRDCQSLKITCMDRHFAISTSDGKLRLFDTVTSQPWHTIVHGERILIFKFSTSYERCVTYGFRETKVWLVKERRQLYSIKNPTHAKALDVAFSGDETALLSCSDDKSTRRCLLDTTGPTWHVVRDDHGFDSTDGTAYNSPRRTVFNAVGTQVAVAFRGFPLLIWDVEGAELIGRCERESDRNKSRQDLYSEVGPLCWNPMTGHVLGLYKDGCIFKWHPLESYSQEIRTVETGIQCSPDGALFLTSNSDGMLKVWDFHHLTMIYRLSCHSPVTDMALSVDGRRIYDLRESFCNIWEPNALIRLAEADEKSSETSSTTAGSTQLSLAAEGPLGLSGPLAALAIGPRTSLYCCGDEVGVVRLSGPETEASCRIAQGFMPVDHIAWSNNEDYLVTADLGGRLNVRSRESPIDPTSPTNYPLLFEAKTGHGLRQVLFSSSAEYLLIVTVAFIELWSLEAKSMVVTIPNTLPYSRWITHPAEENLLVQCTFGEVRLWQWSDLVEHARFYLDRGPPVTDLKPDGRPDHPRRYSSSFPMSPEEDYDAVDELYVSPTDSRLVLQTSSPSGQRRRSLNYLSINTDALAAGRGSKHSTIVTKELPSSITNKIARILGFAREVLRRPSYGRLSEAVLEPEDVLVFLDKDDWVCSFACNGGISEDCRITKHFFLPQDWLNSDSLRLATVSNDGKFYCPRNGEVAIVSNWLQNEWKD